MPYSNGILTKPISIGDVQNCLNISSTDLGTICTSNRINMYSSHKPMRYSNPCGIYVLDGNGNPQDDRYRIYYGMFANASAVDLKYGLTEQNPYWTYLKPRGKGQGENGADEWFRLLDFDEYDHNAVCPVKALTGIPSELTLHGTGGTFQFSLEDAFEDPTNPHVQLTLDIFPAAYGVNDYFGLCIWNKTQHIGYYLTTKYKLHEVVNKDFDSYSSISMNLDDISDFEGGDECEMFYCSSFNCTEDEQQGTISWRKARNQGEVQLIAPDANHGHTVFTVKAINVALNLGFQSDFVNNINYLRFAYTYQSDFVMTGFYCRLQCDYDWNPNGTESFEVAFRLVLEGSTTWNKTATLTSTTGNGGQYYILSMSGSYTKDWSSMRDDDERVSVELFVRLPGQSINDDTRIGRFTIDIPNSCYYFTY